MAYFDNAATSFPKPDVVYSFMDEFYRNNGASAGRGNYKAAMSSGRLIAETRRKVQHLLHCPTKQVIFTPTATIALNMVIQGLINTKKIKNIYISPFEHNAVTRTLYAFEKQGIIKVFKLFVSDDLNYNIQRIQYQFEDYSPDLIVMSHASNAFGLVAPVEKIFELGKKFNSINVLDMAQTAGLIDINVGLNIFDFAIFAGHKTLYGPTGVSGFVMDPTINLPSVLFGGTGYDSANQDMPDSLPERYEMGTLNICGIAGFYAALDWISSVSVNTLHKKEMENRNQLIEILKRYHFIKIIGNNPEREYVGIVSCIIDGISSESAGKMFDDADISVRTGLHCAPLAHQFMNTYPAGTIRFSVNYFTKEEDFQKLISFLDNIEDSL